MPESLMLRASGTFMRTSAFTFCTRAFFSLWLMALTRFCRQKDKRMVNSEGEEKMKKQGPPDRRKHTAEFKVEAVAPVEKREKPVSQAAADLGVNESMLRRWMQEARGTAETGRRAFPGCGRPRDEELTRLHRENKALKAANEILKKRRPSSRGWILCAKMARSAGGQAQQTPPIPYVIRNWRITDYPRNGRR